jgi:hypothetical protein
VTASWPTFDVAEIAQEASERAGIDFRSAHELRSARRALELLGIEWANRGLNLWTIEGPIPVTLVANNAQYSIPDDTVDLIEHSLRIPASVTGTIDQDFPLDRFTVSQYFAIPNKMAPGRPSIIHIRRGIQPYFFVWMVPDGSIAYQVVYWRMRRLGPLGRGGVGQPDIPWRFIPAMTAGLAFYMALKSKDPNVQQKIPLLKGEYTEQFGLASDEDRDRASFRFVPGGYEFI